MKKIFAAFAIFIFLIVSADLAQSGTTANYGWDYGTQGQDPWWNVWLGIFTNIDTSVFAIETKANNLITLSGRASGSTHLGTFTGITIPDNQTIKDALQALETAFETGVGYRTVQEEGASLAQRATLNFIGAGITAADDAGNTRTNVTLNTDLNTIASLACADNQIMKKAGGVWTCAADDTGAGGGYTTVQEEGANLTQRATLNFVGSGITAADDAGNTRTNVTLDADLNALADLATTGIIARTAAGTVSTRTITGDAEIVVSNGDGVAGNPTLSIGAGITRDSELTTHASTSSVVHGATGTIVGTSDTQTLTNKTLTDSTTYFQDNLDNTKKFQFQVSGVTAGQTRTVSIPDSSGTIEYTGHTHTSGNVTDFNEAAQDAVGAAMTDTTTINFTYNDGANQITADVVDNTSIQKVTVRKNTGADVGSRKRLNLVEGSNVTLTVADDGVSDEVDITIAAPGVSGYNVVQEEGAPVTQRTVLNFIGSGITAADDAGNTRTNVTLDADLNALADLATTGIISRTGAGTVATRTITGDTEIVVSNGDGVAGNPTLSIGAGITRDSELTTHASTSSGVHGATGTIVGTSDTQTLTNKTFDDAFYGKQIATPANPSASYNKLYFKSDNKLYKLTSGGAESEVGAGSGETYGYFSFPAGTLIPDTCSGLLQYKATNNQFDYLAFDGATDEYATFIWFPPDNWDRGTIKTKFIWAAGAAMTNGHTVIWGLAGYTAQDGDSLANAITTGEQTISDAYATGDETGPIQKITSATGAITINGTHANGNPIYFRVHRDADTDTSTADAWLLGVRIQYTKTTDAAW